MYSIRNFHVSCPFHISPCVLLVRNSVMPFRFLKNQCKEGPDFCTSVNAITYARAAE